MDLPGNHRFSALTKLAAMRTLEPGWVLGAWISADEIIAFLV